jgi:hypothetical protein
LQQVARGGVKQQLFSDPVGPALGDCHRDSAASETIAPMAEELDAGEVREHPEERSSQLR